MQWKIYELEKLRTISYVFMIQMQSLELFYEFQFWRGQKSWLKRKLKHAFEHEDKTLKTFRNYHHSSSLVPTIIFTTIFYIYKYVSSQQIITWH